MTEGVRAEISRRIAEFRDAGTYKTERILTGAQGPRIRVRMPDGTVREALNFCANNYLGLAAHPRLVEAARRGLERWGCGLSSVRFICGTQEVHKELEGRLAAFLGAEDAVLFSSCFDANGGVFEPLLDEECALLSDRLNHASLIDGARLCKAKRLVYGHSDMADLEGRLAEAAGARIRMIVTDGVFSMDGDVANLPDICRLAERHGALVAVDDSHATGFVGKTGRGTPELCGVQGRVDVLTTTFGKALGGASGGCVAGRREIVELLRQRSRPYLFSNSLAPSLAAAAVEALSMLEEGTDLRDRLEGNAAYLRSRLQASGFELKPGTHPIIPVMLYDERKASRMAEDLLAEGIYVIGFSYPVVPRGEARIRVQVSAAHSREDLDAAVEAFRRVRGRMDALPSSRVDSMLCKEET